MNTFSMVDVFQTVSKHQVLMASCNYIYKVYSSGGHPLITVSQWYLIAQPHWQ